MSEIVEDADHHKIKADKRRVRSMGSIDLRISQGQARSRVQFSDSNKRSPATLRTVVDNQALNVAGKALAGSKRYLSHVTRYVRNISNNIIANGYEDSRQSRPSSL